MPSVVRVDVFEDGADIERLNKLTGFLRQELLQLDVEDVTAARAGIPPPGTRLVEHVVIGELLVVLGKSVIGSVIGEVVSAIRAWLARGDSPGRGVRLEIDGDELVLSDATPEDQERLVGLFLSRHATGGGAQ